MDSKRLQILSRNSLKFLIVTKASSEYAVSMREDLLDLEILRLDKSLGFSTRFSQGVTKKKRVDIENLMAKGIKEYKKHLEKFDVANNHIFKSLEPFEEKGDIVVEEGTVKVFDLLDEYIDGK